MADHEALLTLIRAAEKLAADVENWVPRTFADFTGLTARIADLRNAITNAKD